MPQLDDDLTELLHPEPELPLSTAPAPRSTSRNRAKRLPRLPDAWVRVPLQWLTPEGAFGARERLFLLLLYRSYWGQKPVRVTNALAAQVGISPRTKTNVLRDLVERNAVRVEQHGRQAPMVWARVIVSSEGG